MISLILTTLYFALPGMVANMTPILVRKWMKSLAVPIDLGKKLGGKPIFGNHKTYRGFIFGILAAILIAYLQVELYRRGLLHSIAYIDYGRTCFICLGVALGFGALFGDLVKSFFKRRLNVQPGKHWFPWDQIDYALGIIAFSWFIKPMTLWMMIVMLIAGPVLSILASRIGYLLKVREQKW
jgi:CDP-2,3-bis-(O-geranylgeranyl)-sn-glycerol synthase